MGMSLNNKKILRYEKKNVKSHYIMFGIISKAYFLNS